MGEQLSSQFVPPVCHLNPERDKVSEFIAKMWNAIHQSAPSPAELQTNDIPLNMYSLYSVPYIQVRIKGQEYEALLDTGAGCSLMSFATVNRLGLPIQSSNERIRSVDTRSVRCMGKVVTDIVIFDRVCSCEFIVLENTASSIILGIDFINTWKIIPHTHDNTFRFGDDKRRKYRFSGFRPVNTYIVVSTSDKIHPKKEGYRIIEYDPDRIPLREPCGEFEPSDDEVEVQVWSRIIEPTPTRIQNYPNTRQRGASDSSPISSSYFSSRSRSRVQEPADYSQYMTNRSRFFCDPNNQRTKKKYVNPSLGHENSCNGTISRSSYLHGKTTSWSSDNKENIAPNDQKGNVYNRFLPLVNEDDSSDEDNTLSDSDCEYMGIPLKRKLPRKRKKPKTNKKVLMSKVEKSRMNFH